MISFEKWQKLYLEILKFLQDEAIKNSNFLFKKKISKFTTDLLERLNQLIFSYEEIQYKDKNDEQVVSLSETIIIAIDKLLVDESIKSNLSISNKLTYIKSEAIRIKLIQLPMVIYNLIKNNQANEARELLKSEFATENKDDISCQLILRFCTNHMDEDKSILCIRLLKEINTNFNNQNIYADETILFATILRNPKLAIIKELVNSGAQVNLGCKYSNELTPLHIAACSGHVDIVEFLLQSGAFPNQIGDSVKLKLAEKKSDNYLKIIELLFNAGSKILNNNSFMKLIVQHAHLRAINLLNSLGVSFYDGIAYDAIATNDLKFLTHLLSKYKISIPKDIPHRCELEMFQFCFYNKMSLKNYSLCDVVVLKTAEAAIQCYDRDKNINLQFNDISSFRLHGINGKCSFAHFVAAYSSPEVLAFFISKGLDINERTSNQLTPLHYATVYNNIENLKILILAGANINAQDNEGKTALHWAVEEGMAMSTDHIPCAEILLYNGADPKIKNNGGLNPRECLYTGGCHPEDRIKLWNKTFTLTKKAEIKFNNVSNEESYDCCLIEIENKNQICDETLLSNRSKRIPLLIRENDKYFIYGDTTGIGDWKFSEIINILSEQKQYLAQLPFKKEELVFFSHHLISLTLKNILKKGHICSAIPSLSKLATLFIANSSKLTANLAYRNKLPPDLSEQIEKIASNYLAPKKQ